MKAGTSLNVQKSVLRACRPKMSSKVGEQMIQITGTMYSTENHSCSRGFSPGLSQLSPLSGLTPATSPSPIWNQL